MHDKLEEISWVAEQPWVESQVITHTMPTEVDNVDDDLARELAFYNQVLCYIQHNCCMQHNCSVHLCANASTFEQASLLLCFCSYLYVSWSHL